MRGLHTALGQCIIASATHTLHTTTCPFFGKHKQQQNEFTEKKTSHDARFRHETGNKGYLHSIMPLAVYAQHNRKHALEKLDIDWRWPM